MDLESHLQSGSVVSASASTVSRQQSVVIPVMKGLSCRKPPCPRLCPSKRGPHPMIDYNKAVKAWHSWPTWAFLGQLSRAISAHLLSHHFQGSGVWHAFTGSSAQGLPQAESRFQVKLLSHLGHGTLSQAH